ncbi:MAG: ShlB/FhaC/HecB family hemolysin secretion/activation protein [Methylomonas sp.]|jgi:hemolysin activation/secretion protein
MSPFRSRLLLWFICLLTSFICLAETTKDGPHFTIRRYVIEGNSRVDGSSLTRAVAPFIGENRGFSAIQSAVSAIKSVYKNAGYEAVRVLIPKQEIDDGSVYLQVVEAKLGKVDVKGNKFFDADNIRHATPSLREGETPNVNDLGAELRLSNENNAKQTQVTFRQSDDPHTVDAVVNVADARPWHAATSMDNTGTDQTGNWRWGFAFLHSNVLNLDHVLAAQFVTSPERMSDVQIFGMNYRIPLYRLGDELELSANHSSVNSGVVNTTAGNYGISGSGDNFGAHYIYLLPRFLDWDQRLNIGFDYRIYDNNVTLQGFSEASLVPGTEVHPLSVTYAGSFRQPERQLSFSAGLYQNIPGGGKGDESAIHAARLTADAAYTLVRYAFNFTQNLPKNWQLHTEFNGQQTNDALISGEQFGIGGINSVRGFQERTLSNDKGFRAALEIYTPDFGRFVETVPLKLRALTYFNAGDVWRNFALPGEATFNHISSIGLGFRGNISQNVQMRLDLSCVLDATGVSNVGQKHAQASFVYLF